MVELLLNMLCLLAIIVVGFLILATVAIAIYAILYVVYKSFIDTNNNNGGKR